MKSAPKITERQKVFSGLKEIKLNSVQTACVSIQTKLFAIADKGSFEECHFILYLCVYCK